MLAEEKNYTSTRNLNQNIPPLSRFFIVVLVILGQRKHVRAYRGKDVEEGGYVVREVKYDEETASKTAWD